jgi:hypothetical protein
MKSKKDNKNNKKSKKVLYKPFVSTAKNKKYSVYVKSNSGGVKLIISEIIDMNNIMIR